MVLGLRGPEHEQHSQATGVQDAPMSQPAGTSISRWKEEDLRENTVIEGNMEEARPPYIHAMLAGGLGGLMGDMLMHSLDTVKTRQQGDPNIPSKYTSMGSTFRTMWRQEGLRGLYGGVTPAFLGSFFGTTVFFGSYEWSKRQLIDMGIAPAISHFTAGLMADAAASPLYVPTEVLKTRLQLQGRHNNPSFNSGYNYKSSWHALRTIVRTEGAAELFSGYKATLARDLPFSALQFAFYEQWQKLAKRAVGPGREIGLPLEIVTGASAGGLAGVLTCPLDVVKTRIQTQLDPAVAAAVAAKKKAKSGLKPAVQPNLPPSHPHLQPAPKPEPTLVDKAAAGLKRHISTGGPSTTLRAHNSSLTLDTESVLAGLRIIYRAEGFAGWFRGVGPRATWTSVQSGTMLVMYQTLLRWFEANPLVDVDE